MTSPNTNDPSLAQSVRLRLSYWQKLRELMQHYGSRVWLEKAIDRAHKKMSKDA